MRVIIQHLFFLMFAVTAVGGYAHGPGFDDFYRFDDSKGGGSVPASAITSRSATLAEADEVFQLMGPARCTSNNTARGYPCKNINLRSFLPKSQLGAANVNLNDIWGWTDPLTGAEIAIIGLEDGTSFVDITESANPVFLGKLPSRRQLDGGRDWRDIKVYNDHAYIVADGGANRRHGLQVFDLRKLRQIVAPPKQLRETAHFNGFGLAHNIAINEDSGYAYVVGSDQCSGGLYMVNITNPIRPRYRGCFSADGYTHDAQCVTYNGPDGRFSGREICFAYNEDSITIVDVTNKQVPRLLSKTVYSNNQYTHQGWLLDENQSILIMNDELDEYKAGLNTTSYIFDVANLRRPKQIGTYVAANRAIDHNLYTKDGYVFESNYRSGLRILSAEDIHAGNLREVAYFDVIPASDSTQFSGAWSSYIYFASRNIAISDIGGGLFVVRPDWSNFPNDDRPIELSVDDIVVNESGRWARVTIRLSRISNRNVMVTAATRAGSASARTDFKPKSRRFRFYPGQTTKKFTIRIINDRVDEAAERLMVRLSNSRNATISNRLARVTIRDDD